MLCVLCFVFRFSCIVFRVSCFRFRVSGFGFQIWGFGFRVSGLMFRVPGFRVAVPRNEGTDAGLSVVPTRAERTNPSSAGVPNCLVVGAQIGPVAGFEVQGSAAPKRRPMECIDKMA